jgi:hypothetical protein
MLGMEVVVGGNRLWLPIARDKGQSGREARAALDS